MALEEWTIDDLMDQHNSPSRLQQPPEVISNGVDGKIFANNTLRQTKQLSQLIATSWLDDERGKEIGAILRRTTASDSELKELLTGNKPELWREPIFTEEEIALYRFKIDWNSYIGLLIEEPQAVFNQEPPYFTLTLPCPPRPALGETNLTYEQIENWVNSPLEYNEQGVIKNPFPPHPYIPASCC